MDNIIYVNIDMFGEQTIQIYRNGSTNLYHSTIDELPETILKLCKENNITKVKINNTGNYTKEIANLISLKEKTYYSENKINIEVI